MPAPLLGGDAHVVAVSLASVLGRVGVHHTAATWCASQQSLQDRPELIADPRASCAMVRSQQPLNFLERFRINNRLVLTLVDFVLVSDLAEVGDVRQQPVQRIFVEWLAATLLSLLRHPAFCGPATPIEFGNR